MNKFWLSISAAALLLHLSSCACGPGSSTSADGGKGAGAGGSGAGTGGSTSGGTGGSTSGGTGGSTSGGTGGSTGTAEVCDGIDNDGDGVVDNVDVGMDGVCDCLKIATLGYRGKYGQGDVFNQWLNGKSLSGAVGLENKTLTADLLAPFQVLVIQDVREGTDGVAGVGFGIRRTFSAAEVSVLEDWVKKGGGVMTLIGYADPSEVVNVNTLLKPYGLSYGTAPILPAPSAGTTAPATQWASHPLADGIKKIGADNGYSVLGGGTLIAWEPTPGSVDVARAVELDKGHVLVWGDEWITYNSEWTKRTDYQVQRFWLNSLKWLTPANQCQVTIPPDIN